MISINAVRYAVISTLKEHFPSTKIYGEEIAQGFKEPCFFVKLFPVSQERELGRRYRRFHTIDIHYFTSTNEDRHEMAERLYALMEYIPINDRLYRGTKLYHEIIDGVLHFFVDYNFHVKRFRPDETKMERLEFGGMSK